MGKGEIRSPEDACAMVTQTACDAVMIGRTAPSNPWIFRQIEQYCQPMENAAMSKAPHSGNAHVGTAAPGCPVEQSSTVFDVAHSMAVLDTTREGHDFSRAEIAISQAALAAEVRFHPDAQSYDEPTEADRYQLSRTYFQMLIEAELRDALGKMKQCASCFTHGV